MPNTTNQNDTNQNDTNTTDVWVVLMVATEFESDVEDNEPTLRVFPSYEKAYASLQAHWEDMGERLPEPDITTESHVAWDLSDSCAMHVYIRRATIEEAY